MVIWPAIVGLKILGALIAERPVKPGSRQQMNIRGMCRGIAFPKALRFSDRGLDLKGLRSRWQSVFRRPAPAHLTRHLLFAVFAYRLPAKLCVIGIPAALASARNTTL